jgi:HlyD family secretion protein
VQRRAEVRAAEAQLANARRVADRLKETARRGASSELALDDALAAVDVAQAELEARRAALDLALEGTREEEIAEARAQVEALQARVALLDKRIADTVLRAPSRGVIQSRILEVGEMADPSRPAFVMALIEPKWVRAYLPQPQMGLVGEGMRASVLCDSFPGRPFEGWVGFISPTAEFTPKSVQTEDLRTQLVYEVRVWVQDPENELRLGTPVTVHIDPGAPLIEGDRRAASPSRSRTDPGEERDG